MKEEAGPSNIPIPMDVDASVPWDQFQYFGDALSQRNSDALMAEDPNMYFSFGDFHSQFELEAPVFPDLKSQ